MRAPLTAMVFAVELTHDFNVMPALLAGSIASFAVTALWLRRSILTEKLARRGQHITCEYSIDPFELARVQDVMDTQVPTVPSTMKLQELARRIAAGDPILAGHQATLVLDPEQRLKGIVTRGDIIRALPDAAENETLTVEEAGSSLSLSPTQTSLWPTLESHAGPEHRAHARGGTRTPGSPDRLSGA
ncbi:CBS domain-containing protein [Verrucomicrobium spinosum]|uniref:CBS domain-containing protein n=1 Tax=Verrucomicrobium spinosum TaxID=2736 RepID=UPI00210F141A|nr:CBS domain-containing protein [Verrucomicrobium spinosum]